MWSARDLAGHGYVVLIVAALGQGGSEPVGVGPCLVSNPTSGSCPLPGPPGDFSPISINSSNLVDAEISGVDWLLSSSDPLPVDPSRIGAEGFSAGAIASSIAQQLDPRLKAIVALDNLTSRRSGDEGQASCPANDSVEPGDLIVPRAPALGEASDSCPVDLIGADRKKDGWSHWRAATVPSMEVVFKGTTHMSFGGGKTGTKTPEQTTHEFEYYVRSWFDRWLQGDTSAESSLLSSTVEGAPTASFLSATYHSAAYLPDLGVDCGDLGQCLTP
jgi:dienelactone hydrolase